MPGYDFGVTGTDGSWILKQARWPEVTIDCAVGQMRAFEFDAVNPGDWAIHCHKAHHTMNAMGHSVPTTQIRVGISIRKVRWLAGGAARQPILNGQPACRRSTVQSSRCASQAAGIADTD